MGEHCFAAMDAVYEMYPYLQHLDFEDRLVFFNGSGSEEETFRLDLGRVGEVAEVWLDGKKLGQRIIPPYRFEFTAKPGAQLKLCVVTTSHLGYAQQDGFSAYLGFDPVGLLGPVALEG